MNDVSQFGPTTKEFWQDCVLSTARIDIPLALMSAAVFFVAVVCLTLDHRRRLLKHPTSRQQAYFERLTLMPLVFGTCAFLTLLTPRSWPASTLVMKQYEAYTLYCFGRCIFLLVGREAEARTRQESVRHNPQKQALLPVDAGDANETKRILLALRAEGPRKFYATPPCLCWFRLCMTARPVVLSDMRLVLRLLDQFVIVSVSMSLMLIWLRLAWNIDTPFKKFGKVIESLSGLVAIQGTVILLFATVRILDDWCIKLKFVSIKILIAISTIQEGVIGFFVPATAGFTGKCSLHGESQIQFWVMWFVTVESVLLAVLHRFAYSDKELPGAEDFDGVRLLSLTREIRELEEAEEELRRAANQTQSATFTLGP